MTVTVDPPPLILAVDDEPVNLHAMQRALGERYELVFATGGERALALARERRPALILLDVLMDDLDGFEVCRRLKQDAATAHIPVIFVTMLSATDDETEGFAVGGVDYIHKPIRPAIVHARVRTHLSLVHADRLRAAHLELMQRLGRAAEFKTDESSGHIVRMSHYSRLLAQAVGCSPRWCEDLMNTAPLHDVGKIGIPDDLLRKPGKLDAAEWAVLRRHPEMGATILGESPGTLLQMARTIALEHHERWDGSGYPRGKAGVEIALEARIVAIADVFDALTTRRAYKEAWPIDDALRYITENAGSHFDPELAATFLGLRAQIEEIYFGFADATLTADAQHDAQPSEHGAETTA